MQSLPCVSILMTCYNRENYIAEAIESVLNCGYKNFELIVVDDCSKDKTLEFATRYASLDKRIRLFVNERNLGDYQNRNRASGYARGKYLVNVDSDDTMFPGILGKWVEEMEANKARFGIFTNLGDGKTSLLQPDESVRKHFFDRPILSFGPCATIVQKSFFVEMKAFPEKYGPANDMFHHVKLASATPTLFFPYPLVNYRLHDAQERNNEYGYLFNNYRYLRDLLQVVQLPLERRELAFLEKKNKRRFVLNLAKFLFQTGDVKRTAKAVRDAQFTVNDFSTAIFHR